MRAQNFGLTQKTLKQICNVLRNHNEVDKAKIYGSRAIGSSRFNSDIDLVLYGDIDYHQRNMIAHELDQLPLPYLFDIEIYDQINHNELKEHIDRYGKVLFNKIIE